MKQAATILLMGILAFNWMGYRLLSSFLEHRSDTILEAKIDREEYDEGKLVELRVPLNAPYLSFSSDFERVQGELEIEGIVHKYVKRKVENGELVLLCIPHEDKTKIQNSRDDFFQLVNDVGNTTDNQNSKSYKSLTSEYYQVNNTWSIPSINLNSTIGFTSVVAPLKNGFNAIPEQPPRF